jgi:hypothetical protein
MNIHLVKIFSFLYFSLLATCHALDPELMTKIQFSQNDMILMPAQKLWDKGLSLSDVVNSLERYHETQKHTQSLVDFRSNPSHYFSQRLNALDNLLNTLYSLDFSHPILDTLKSQAENKKLYIRALPSMQDPYCTKPEAIELLPAKLIYLRDYYALEALDPLHRSGIEIQQYRWQGSSIPNFFIYLDTVENDELLKIFAPASFQVKYFYTEETRNAHRLHFIDGLAYNYKGQLFDTSSFDACHSGEGYAIFVIGEDLHFYVNNHLKDHFHHSSEFAGCPVAGAGEISVVNVRDP